MIPYFVKILPESISIDIVLTIKINLDAFFAVERFCYCHDTIIKFI